EVAGQLFVSVYTVEAHLSTSTRSSESARERSSPLASARRSSGQSPQVSGIYLRTQATYGDRIPHTSGKETEMRRSLLISLTALIVVAGACLWAPPRGGAAALSDTAS